MQGCYDFLHEYAYKIAMKIITSTNIDVAMVKKDNGMARGGGAQVIGAVNQTVTLFAV